MSAALASARGSHTAADRDRRTRPIAATGDRGRCRPDPRPRADRGAQTTSEQNSSAFKALATSDDQAIGFEEACAILDSLPDLSEALAAADPELRRRVFDAFRLSVTLDRNACQIQVKALISSAFSKVCDLESLVANGAIAGAGFEPATSGL
jgi:hypothetical protein